MSTAPAPELGSLHILAPSALRNGIHVWLLPRHNTASINGRAEHDRWLGLLSTSELERAGRFQFARHAADFAANRGRLRCLLAHYLNTSPDRLDFSYGPMGKPALAPEHGEISFNLSHTDGMAIVAIARRGRLGVDIEKRDRATDAVELARRFFSQAEQQAIESQNTALERQQAFLRCWTRKEAFLKGLGDGLSRPLADFSVSCGPSHPQLLDCGWDRAAIHSWRLAELDASDGFTAAVAYEGPSFDVLNTFTWPHNL